jgi:hypothetical protein
MLSTPASLPTQRPDGYESLFLIVLVNVGLTLFSYSYSSFYDSGASQGKRRWEFTIKHWRNCRHSPRERGSRHPAFVPRLVLLPTWWERATEEEIQPRAGLRDVIPTRETC